ncbi:hypothetical protein BCR39DRAFT_494590 [Naematelia encephala]|uniref:Pyridoxamine 5'-phosphate oxidase Alr4036 family FMN-binding domain-containing protein n=1 Tax=Naematelia encephala TaxID=71784 RepID=A0A1Y2B896_9TREE|nr:hypothetical protein BCR39DRAFT_494590 [Naematelia encephala]
MSVSSAVAPKPEWVEKFESIVKPSQDYTTYALSTLNPEGKPKVRHVIHRDLTPSALFLTTTDTRMQKPVHLRHDPTVEIAWWIVEPAVQFRITGQAYVIPPANEADSASKFHDILTGLGLDPDKNVEGKPEWWEGQRKLLWDKAMSGHLRGSFGRPPPGTPLSEIEQKPEDWISSLPNDSDDPKVKKDIEYALSHFALLAIKPTGFELLELKATPNKRTQWTLKGDEWVRVEVAP